MEVRVRIKDSIARKGCGFYDIDGSQELFPRNEKGGIDIKKEFTVNSTPFIESKIASGELILLERIEDTSSGDAEKKNEKK
jgi:hypothetical protein